MYAMVMAARLYAAKAKHNDEKVQATIRDYVLFLAINSVCAELSSVAGLNREVHIEFVELSHFFMGLLHGIDPTCFHDVRSLYAKMGPIVAAQLAKFPKIKEMYHIGEPTDVITVSNLLSCIYQNILTNATGSQFFEIVQGNPFLMQFIAGDIDVANGTFGELRLALENIKRLNIRIEDLTPNVMDSILKLPNDHDHVTIGDIYGEYDEYDSVSSAMQLLTGKNLQAIFSMQRMLSCRSALQKQVTGLREAPHGRNFQEFLYSAARDGVDGLQAQQHAHDHRPSAQPYDPLLQRFSQVLSQPFPSRISPQQFAHLAFLSGAFGMH
jgi:hypothetical protein